MSKVLTDKQKLFCREYIVDFNGTRAYKAAKFKVSSDNSAAVLAGKLLRNIHIQECIKKLAQQHQENVGLNAEWVLQELMKVAGVDIKDVYDDAGNLKPIHEIEDSARRAIASIETEELYEGFGKDRVQIGHTKKIRYWDKLKALDLLGKHLKLFSDRVEIEAGKSLEDLIGGSFNK